MTGPRSLCRVLPLVCALLGATTNDPETFHVPPLAPQQQIATLLERTPHLVRLHVPLPPGSGYLGYFEFDDAPQAGGLVAAGFTAVLDNGQRVFIVPMASGGTYGDQDALIYTTIQGRVAFVGYIPAPVGRLFVFVDSHRRLASLWLDPAAVTVHGLESMAEQRRYVILTTYALTGIRLRALATRAVTLPER